jgi:hypothetical protein
MIICLQITNNWRIQFNIWTLFYIYINCKRTSIHNVFQKIDEWIPYEKKSLNMKKLNDEWKLIVNDILH